jgi:LPXTG-motif cell wall-anchored protein
VDNPLTSEDECSFASPPRGTEGGPPAASSALAPASSSPAGVLPQTGTPTGMLPTVVLGMMMLLASGVTAGRMRRRA